MSGPLMKNRIARCVCGSVELETTGEPILSTACYCDDCQEAGGEIERLPSAPPVLDQAGGTEFLLFRKDRMKCTKGEEHLWDHKLKKESPTKRVITSCCNSFMFLNFQKGHWFSMCRKRFVEDTPPPQMRIQTKFKPEGTDIPNGAAIYLTYPLKFIANLMIARVAMLIHK
jgi:hypothetical protein